MSPTIASPIKVITIDHTRSLDPDIVHGMPHWREGEACYATLTSRSGEQVTGLVVTAEIDALLTRMARAATSRRSSPHDLRLLDTAQGGATGAP
jgi:hypothetical protein